LNPVAHDPGSHPSVPSDADYVDAFAVVREGPIGVPLLYSLVLLPNRTALLERRSTVGTRATVFLHKEYEPRYFFWETIFVFQRMLVIGFFRLIPDRLSLIRLQLGLLTTLVYMVLLLFMKPFKREDLDILAIGSQICVLAFFFGALNIKLHEEVTDHAPDREGLALAVTGFTSALELAMVIFSFNMMTLVLFFATTLYQMVTTPRTKTLRLVSTDQPPELTIDAKSTYHLFLSHVSVAPLLPSGCPCVRSCSHKNDFNWSCTADLELGPGSSGRHQATDAIADARNQGFPRCG
jgi:hypothetical protein